MNFLFIAFFLLLNVCVIYGQTNSINIEGIVFDEKNKPLSNASVILLNDSGEQISGARTDNKGKYIFENFKKDNFVLKYFYLSYLPMTHLIYAKNIQNSNVICNVWFIRKKNPVSTSYIKISKKQETRKD
jgi:hypothetical protein